MPKHCKLCVLEKVFNYKDECLFDSTITIDEASINVNSLYKRWMNLGEYMIHVRPKTSFAEETSTYIHICEIVFHV